MTMSFFGKLKNLHNVPPPPPRRTDNADFSWPQEEFLGSGQLGPGGQGIPEEEDGDMYEAPPCERPPMTVPPRQVEEDVYLERTSSPAVPQRHTVPPPRPGKISKPHPRAEEPHYESNTKKPPEINRTEKPGKKMMALPRPEPTLLPAASTEEDVYLDPNEDQDLNDPLYLEPTAACSPPPPMRMPPSPKTAFAPSPIPMMKPPVPRAKSNLVLPSMNEVKTALGVEARRATYPKLPLLTTNIKPLFYSPLNPPVADTKPAGSSTGVRSTKQSGNEDKEWFAGDCNRKTAEDLLLRVHKDGAFLIRHSSAQNSRQPYTLAVLYQQKVYNIPVRFLEETERYALGKEGKKSEEMFTSLDEMIFYHTNNQLLLIDSKSQAKHSAYLTHPVRP